MHDSNVQIDPSGLKELIPLPTEGIVYFFRETNKFGDHYKVVFSNGQMLHLAEANGKIEIMSSKLKSVKIQNLDDVISVNVLKNIDKSKINSVVNLYNGSDYELGKKNVFLLLLTC